MKFRVEFRKYGEKVSYFKDVSAINATDARTKVAKLHPESGVMLTYPMPFIEPEAPQRSA